MAEEKKESSGPRELIDPGNDKRYQRRDDNGQFGDSDDQGKSLSHDVKQHSDTQKPENQGDKGDEQS